AEHPSTNPSSQKPEWSRSCVTALPSAQDERYVSEPLAEKLSACEISKWPAAATARSTPFAARVRGAHSITRLRSASESASSGATGSYCPESPTSNGALSGQNAGGCGTH